MPNLGITISGKRFAGWKTVSVHRSIEHISGAFDIAMAEIEPNDPTLRSVVAGQGCTVDLDGDTVLTGWVDDVVTEWGGSEHTVRVTGRDATGDLVDCAAARSDVQWKNRKLEHIVAAICRPFGISVRAETDTGEPFAKEGVTDGESAFTAIERLCRQRAVLPVSDARGGLVLTRAGVANAGGSLAYGTNILGAEFTASNRGRFSEYIVKGHKDPVDTWDGLDPTGSITAVRGSATDPYVTRYRPMILIGEAKGDATSYRDRAKWEASVRAGRARRGSYTVQGWRDAAGKLWAPNTLVAIRDPFAGVDRALLIAGVEYQRGDRGTVSVLSVVRKEAFDLIELPAPETGNAGSELWNKGVTR